MRLRQNQREIDKERDAGTRKFTKKKRHNNTHMDIDKTSGLFCSRLAEVC